MLTKKQQYKLIINMAYNEKTYGIVSTDGATGVSVAAPTRDDYYPTMYEVKKYVDSKVSSEENTPES